MATRPKNNETAPSVTSTQPVLRYEEALEELQNLLTRLESGQLPLDALLSSYQRGAELLALCREQLCVVENQIQTIDAD